MTPEPIVTYTQIKSGYYLVINKSEGHTGLVHIAPAHGTAYVYSSWVPGAVQSINKPCDSVALVDWLDRNTVYPISDLKATALINLWRPSNDSKTNPT